MRALVFGLTMALALGGCAHSKGNKVKQAPTPIPVAAAPKPPAPKQPPKSVWYYISPFTWIHAAGNLLPHKAKPPAAQPPQLVGTVKMVNKEDKFVLIDGASFQGAAAGDPLICIINQKETANLRMSTMKNPPFLIADITSGMPSPGDKVYKP